jgi:hypothetical protein
MEGHIAHMGETRNVYNILVGKLEKRDNLRELTVRVWAGFIWLMTVTRSRPLLKTHRECLD